MIDCFVLCVEKMQGGMAVLQYDHESQHVVLLNQHSTAHLHINT